MRTVSYFAFGSNMLSVRLQARTPSARPLGTVELTGWRLAFHKRGADGSGKGDLVAAPETERVFGVVYSLAEAEVPILDRFEGPGYDRHLIDVRLGDAPLRCLTYQASPEYIDAGLKPYHWYRRLILAGLLEHGAEDAYIAAVSGCPWRRDPFPFRPARRRALSALRAFNGRYPRLASRLATL
jgi:hypothetical protein